MVHNTDFRKDLGSYQRWQHLLLSIPAIVLLDHILRRPEGLQVYVLVRVSGPALRPAMEDRFIRRWNSHSSAQQSRHDRLG
jgi:hypothetical protein